MSKNKKSFWTTKNPECLGFNRSKLLKAGTFIADKSAENPYRITIVRQGKIVVEWYYRIDAYKNLNQGSITESILCSLLGITISEKIIRSINDKVGDYYPEFVQNSNVGLPQKHPYLPNTSITFHHLISGLYKDTPIFVTPKQQLPLKRCGMNILSHAIAANYNLYKTEHTDKGAGIGALAKWKIMNPIGLEATWKYKSIFDPSTTINEAIFGHKIFFYMNSRNMAKLGLLWLNYGNWQGQQIIPTKWVQNATSVPKKAFKEESPEQHKLGLGFWSNSKGKMWPNLPSDSFASIGNNKQHIWVCPSLDLVVVQSPGVYDEFVNTNYSVANFCAATQEDFLCQIVDSLQQ